MAINNKVKVPVVGAANRSILINAQATEGAVFGKDLFFSDGKTVVTIQNLAAALGVTKQSAQPVILWNQLTEIPPNVTAVANLDTAGVVRRLPDGTWITQPPTDFIGRAGPPGRRGERGTQGIPGIKGADGRQGIDGNTIPGRRGARGQRGFPGPPGAAGAAGPQGVTGASGVPGPAILRRGSPGRQGFRGPPGERGATGAQGPQGPAGSASSASGFPGYRQNYPRPRLLPPLDNAAPVKWSATHTYLKPFTAAGTNGDAPITLKSTNPAISLIRTSQAADEKIWDFAYSGSSFLFRSTNDAGSTVSSAFQFDRTGVALTKLTFGNTTDNPAMTFAGTGQVIFGAMTNPAGAGTLNFGGTQPTFRIQDNSGTNKTAFDFYAQTTACVINANFGTSAVALNLQVGSTEMIGMPSNKATIKFSISGSEAITINGAATTGINGAVITGTNTKPGAGGSPGPAKWLPVSVGGTQYYIPMWP